MDRCDRNIKFEFKGNFRFYQANLNFSCFGIPKQRIKGISFTKEIHEIFYMQSMVRKCCLQNSQEAEKYDYS